MRASVRGKGNVAEGVLGGPAGTGPPNYDHYFFLSDVLNYEIFISSLSRDVA